MELYVSQFLDHGRRHRGYSHCTIRGYGGELRAWMRWLRIDGVTDISTVSREHIDRYSVEQGDLRPRTVRRKIAAIRAFMAYLTEQQTIRADPSLKLKLPQYDDPTRTAPTPAEHAALFDGCNRLECTYTGRLASAMIAVMCYAGLRPMEAIALSVGDVDLVRRKLIVQQGKGGKRREVPLNDTLADVLTEWLRVRYEPGTGTPLLVTNLRRPLTYYLLRTVFNRVKVAAGLRDAKHLTAHCLRHWFASSMRSNKVDLLTISKLMGHANLSTTQSYLHTVESELSDAVRSLDAPRPATERHIRTIQRKR